MSYWLDKNAPEGHFKKLPKTVKGEDCCPECGSVGDFSSTWLHDHWCWPSYWRYLTCTNCGFEVREVYEFSRYEVSSREPEQEYNEGEENEPNS